MLEILYFTATWCAPCKKLAPLMEELEGENAVVVRKRDIEEYPTLAQSFGIMSVPTLIFMRDGEILTTKTRGFTKQSIQEVIDKYV